MQQQFLGLELNKKTVISLLFFILIVISIPLGMYLVKKQTIFRSRALESQNQFQKYLAAKADFKSRLYSSFDTGNFNSQYDLDGDGIITFKDYIHALNGVTQSRLSTNPSISGNAKGFIVEFKDPPLLEQLPVREGHSNLKSQSQEEFDYQSTLKQKRSQIKNEILSRLHKSNFTTASPKASGIQGLVQSLFIRQDQVEILGDYSKVFNGVALNISQEEAENLKQLADIKAIHPNRLAKTMLSDSVPMIKAPDVWNSLKDKNNQAVTGKGIKVAVIDTGVDYTHPDLGGCSKSQFLAGKCSKVISGYSFVTCDFFGLFGDCLRPAQPGNDPMDQHYHGTHVAATVAGNGVLKGVAPDAQIIAYRALNSQGIGTESEIIQAIERSVDPNDDGDTSDHVDILSMSLGKNCQGEFSSSCGPDDPWSVAIDRASKAGVVAVIAAGNSGPDDNVLSSPGVARTAITVGANDKSNKLARFSSGGPVLAGAGDYQRIKPDVTAPGVDICAALLQSLHLKPKELYCLDQQHIKLSGTSMATPHVTGAVALIKQAHPDWSVEQIKSALMTTASDIGTSPIFQGSGEINVFRASKTTTFITPASVALDYFNQPTLPTVAVADNTRKVDLLIQNNSLVSKDYTVRLKESLPGVNITVANPNPKVPAGSSSSIQIIAVASSDLAPGGTFGVIEASDGTQTFRVPLAVFKKGLKITTIPQEVGSAYPSVVAQVESPYFNDLADLKLQLVNHLGSTQIVKTFKDSLIKKSLWFSESIKIQSAGDHRLLATSTQIPQNATAHISRDDSVPKLTLDARRDGKWILLNASSDRQLAPQFQRWFVDHHEAYLSANWLPQVYADNSNLYLTYSQLGIDTDPSTNKPRGFYKAYFTFSSNNGDSWSEPVKFTDATDDHYYKIVKFKSSLYIFWLDQRQLMMIASHDNGSSWSNPQKVTDQLIAYIDDTFEVKASSDQMHLVVAAATFDANNSTGLYHLTSSDGSSWSSPQQVAQLMPDYPGWWRFQKVDLSVEGVILKVVYSSKNVIKFAISSDSGKSWQADKVITSKENVFYPKIVSSGDQIYLSWVTFDSIAEFSGMIFAFEKPKITLSKSLDNGVSWNSKEITSADEQEVAPQMALTHNRLYLSFWDIKSYSLYFKVSDDKGDNFSERKLVDKDAIYQGVMISNNESLHLFWPAEVFKNGNVRLAYKKSDNLWGQASFKDKTNHQLINPLSWSQSASGYLTKSLATQAGDYTFTVGGLALPGNAANSSQTLTTDGKQTQTLSLNANWNLIGIDVTSSTPFKAEEIANRLKQQTGADVVIIGFDSQHGQALSLFTDPQKAFYFNNLTELESGKGYWIKVEKSASLSLDGSYPNYPYQVSFKKGWQLVDLDYLLDKTASKFANWLKQQTGADVVIIGFDSQHGQALAFFTDPQKSQYFNNLTELESGKGYWLSVDKDINLKINPDGVVEKVQ